MVYIGKDWYSILHAFKYNLYNDMKKIKGYYVYRPNMCDTGYIRTFEFGILQTRDMFLKAYFI
jgi:hypothetical protein